jgi:hypothetical protein
MSPSAPNKDESLNGVVIPNTLAKTHLTEEGLIRISYPVALPRLLRKMWPKTGSLGSRTLELDAMGTFVWQLIDGRRTVRQIAELVGQQYQCRTTEAELAVAQFIRQLGRRNIVGLR